MKIADWNRPEPALFAASLPRSKGRPANIWGHIAETGEAFLIALAIAIVAGRALGLLIGIHKLSAQIVEPLLLAANSVPKITLYPIVLLVFGIGIPAKIAFGAIHGHHSG